MFTLALSTLFPCPASGVWGDGDSGSWGGAGGFPGSPTAVPTRMSWLLRPVTGPTLPAALLSDCSPTSVSSIPGFLMTRPLQRTPALPQCPGGGRQGPPATRRRPSPRGAVTQGSNTAHPRPPPVSCASLDGHPTDHRAPRPLPAHQCRVLLISPSPRPGAGSQGHPALPGAGP